MAKGFIVAHEAWYRTAINGVLNEETPYEINIGDYENDETVTSQGEFCLAWHQLQSPKHPPAMRIEIFDDSMAWLTAAPDLFRELAALHGKNPQPDQIIEILTRLGYEDVTKRENPDAIKKVARSIADSAKRGHDREKYDQDTERVLNDSRDALLSVEDVARAYLDGKTVLYRPVGSGAGEWIVARGTHNIEFDKYEYRVAAKQPSGSMQYSPYMDTEEHTAEHTADTHRGLYRKYHIAKADGSPTDPNADYFVLRLDEENPWGHACREAVLCLAHNLRDEFPQLTSDLLTRYGEKSADTMVIRGPARDAHFDELEVSIARGRIRAGECDKEVSERYEKIWIEDDKVTPLNLCIAEQVVQKGFCDGVVVPRFLRLMNEGRLETRSPLEIDAPWVTLDIGYYGARPPIRIKDQNAAPAPRYRPFTAVEAAAQLGRRITIHKIVGCLFSVGLIGIIVDENSGFIKRFGFDYACEHGVFADTGEPFGVKI